MGPSCVCSAAPLHDKTISFSINRGYGKVLEADVEDALKRRANYMVTYLILSFVTSLVFSDRVFGKLIGNGELF